MASKHLEELYNTRQWEHGPQRDMAIRFLDITEDLDHDLPDGDDKDAALSLLLEARACAIRGAGALLR